MSRESYTNELLLPTLIIYRVLHRQRIQVDLAGQQLPYLALNEVFIGETDPSQ